MAIRIPDFDFETYDPQDHWNFPAQRHVRFAAETYHLLDAARRDAAKRHQLPDLRFSVWHELSGHAHALLLGAMLLRDRQDDLDWWNSQPEFDHVVNKRVASQNQSALRTMLDLGFVQDTMRSLDVTLRTIGTALSIEKEDEKAPLGKLTGAILAAAELREFQPILPMIQIYRDSLSQRGRFCPKQQQDLHFRFQDHRLRFLAGKEIDHRENGFLDQWDFLGFLLRAVTEMLSKLFASTLVNGIPHLRAAHIDR